MGEKGKSLYWAPPVLLHYFPLPELKAETFSAFVFLLNAFCSFLTKTFVLGMWLVFLQFKEQKKEFLFPDLGVYCIFPV